VCVNRTVVSNTIQCVYFAQIAHLASFRETLVRQKTSDQSLHVFYSTVIAPCKLHSSTWFA